MKKLPILFVLALCITMWSCLGDTKTTWEAYKSWRETNLEYYNEMKDTVDKDGQKFYTEIVPSWNQSVSILMHHFNESNPDSLRPLPTSEVAVKYRGTLYNGIPFDSSYLRTDSLYYTRVDENIVGWIIALTNMRVGDSCRVVLPYNVAYGNQSMSSVIRPYSTLLFDIKLEKCWVERQEDH